LRYFFIFIIFHSLLHALSDNDLQQIEDRNRNILLQDKERKKFEQNSHQIVNKNRSIQTLELEEETDVNANCFVIKNFIFHENKILKTDIFAEITDKYKNKCLNQQHIQNILKKINNKYLKKGYITSKAYLKAQDLSLGTLHIYILEGKIEDITFNGKKRSESKTAFPSLEDNILNLRDIEMGLEQINRLYRNHAKLSLQAGEKEGYSHIEIMNQKDKLIFTTASIAGNGLESTGKEVGSLNLFIDDTFGFNSQIHLGANGALKQSHEKRSLGYSFDFSIPYGYFLFSAGYNQFLYRSTIHGENGDYVSSGISNGYNYNIDYTIWRNSQTILKSNFSLNLQQNLNFIANELIKISSNKTTTAQLGFSLSHNLENIQLNSNFTIHKGLSLFDAVINSSDKNKKAQFLKYTASLSTNADFNVKDIPLHLTSFLSGQYSDDRLHSAELFSMGGHYSVRGFRYMNYFGEIGSYIHNDLSYQYNAEIFSKRLNLKPYIGLDMGLIEYDPGVFKHMIGSGLGLQTSFSGFNLSFDFGIPLYAFDPIAEKEYTSSFSLGYSY